MTASTTRPARAGLDLFIGFDPGAPDRCARRAGSARAGNCRSRRLDQPSRNVALRVRRGRPWDSRERVCPGWQRVRRAGTGRGSRGDVGPGSPYAPGGSVFDEQVPAGSRGDRVRAGQPVRLWLERVRRAGPVCGSLRHVVSGHVGVVLGRARARSVDRPRSSTGPGTVTHREAAAGFCTADEVASMVVGGGSHSPTGSPRRMLVDVRFKEVRDGLGFLAALDQSRWHPDGSGVRWSR